MKYVLALVDVVLMFAKVHIPELLPVLAIKAEVHAVQ
jgi:hypothetical protein